MYSRTYDARRFSPLTQIDRQNVSQLAVAPEIKTVSGHNAIYVFALPGK